MQITYYSSKASLQFYYYIILVKNKAKILYFSNYLVLLLDSTLLQKKV